MFSSVSAIAATGDPASSYPSRTIRIIDAFVPRGPSDVFAKLMKQIGYQPQ